MAGYPNEIQDRPERRPLVWAGVWFLLSLVAINMPATWQQPLAAFLRATVLRPFVWTQETLTQARITNAENTTLQAQLDSMIAREVGQNRLVDENLQLRGLLGLAQRMGAGWISASAVRSGTAGSEAIFYLDAGAADGVRVNAPVLTRGGLVGLVIQVAPSTAVAMDWSHPDFGVWATDFEGLSNGFVRSVPGVTRGSDQLRFDGTPFTEDLEEGDIVIASGQGGVYPRGAPIGRVVELAEAGAGWRKAYWLRPYVDPGSVTHVLVGSGAVDQRLDVSAAWPADSILTEAEWRDLATNRSDSLPVYRDSIATLLRRLESFLPPPDTSGGGASPGGR